MLVCAQDQFYCTYLYDQAQRMLTTDRGEIRVGAKYQAEISPLLALPGARPLLPIVPPAAASSPSTSTSTSASAAAAASESALTAAAPASASAACVERRERALHESDARRSQQLETLLWSPFAMDAVEQRRPGGAPVPVERALEQYITVVRSMATFARVVDTSSAVRSFGLQMCAACACRDTTLVCCASRLSSQFSCVSHLPPVVNHDS